MREKFITTNELANDASKILRNIKKGEGVVVLRYSKPVGAVISWEDYKKIENLEKDFVTECKRCLSEVKTQNKKHKRRN